MIRALEIDPASYRAHAVKGLIYINGPRENTRDGQKELKTAYSTETI